MRGSSDRQNGMIQTIQQNQLTQEMMIQMTLHHLP